MKNKFIQLFTTAAICCTGCSAMSTSVKESNSSENFAPKLDTRKSVTLKVSGFLGNFEALDQIVNEFNEYYPDVTITYESNGADQLAEYMQNNPDVDIFMTSDQNIRYKDQPEKYVGDYCIDLSKEDLDLSGIDESYLNNCTVDDKLYSIPLGQNVTGLAVNESLLEKEGLSVPEDYESFMSVLQSLKDKGYVPLQGASSSIGYYLIDGMVMSMLGSDEKLMNGLKTKDEATVSAVAKAIETLDVLKEKGYFEEETDAEYPDDNYDGAIMNFFEGNVPFWVCSSENFSGTKKRETKSEAFTADPFTYSFIRVPLSEDGVYAYSEAWNGFSVNKNSENLDYAIEFMRYLAREEVLSEMAELKGIPGATKNSSDERYATIMKPGKTAVSYINQGQIQKYMHEFLKAVARNDVDGMYSDPQQAAADFVQRCSEVE